MAAQRLEAVIELSSSLVPTEVSNAETFPWSSKTSSVKSPEAVVEANFIKLPAVFWIIYASTVFSSSLTKVTT